MNVIQERTLALAGLFQAIKGVHEISRKGLTDSQYLETAVHSILATDTEETSEVFGGTQAIHPGLDLFRRILTEQVPREQMPMTRYAVSVMHLAKKLRRKPELLNELGEGIEKARGQVEAFGRVHENVLASLADLYTETVGRIPPRVMVTGDDTHLQNPRNVNAIRTLLLAGVRAAVLWYQLGGNRLNLILQRKALAREATRLIERPA